MKKSWLKQLYSFISGMLRKPFSAKKYHIKRGYKHRNAYHHFEAVSESDHCQKEIYETAYKLASEKKLQSVIDLGCGSGYKLVKLFSERFSITGIEIGNTYEKLVGTYPKINWLNAAETDFSNLEADMVICADVIEHVVEPSKLLEQIKSIKKVNLIFISTPDRILARGKWDFGPPKNRTHVREWSKREFSNYINSQGFDILSHEITNYQDATQLIVCRPKL